MADAVAALLEATVPHVLMLRQKGILQAEEVRALNRRRETFELGLRRKPSPDRTDFLRFAQFEIELDSLIKRRCARLGVRLKGSLRFAVIRRVFSIFERSLQRFSHDVSLWREYIRFCEAQKAHKVLSRVLSRALQRHPRAADLWERAGRFEFDALRNVHASRALFQRGLRLCSGSRQDAELGSLIGSRKAHLVAADGGESSAGAARTAAENLWLAYLAMELKYLDIMVKRRKIMSGDKDAKGEKVTHRGMAASCSGNQSLEGEGRGVANGVNDSGCGLASGGEDSDEKAASSDESAESSDESSSMLNESDDELPSLDVVLPVLDAEMTEIHETVAPAVDSVARNEAQDDFWNGGVPHVVALQAISAIPDSCKFRLRLLAALGHYPFGARAAAELRASLRRDFFPHNATAVRHLAEDPTALNGLTWSKSARQSCAVYDEAIIQLDQGSDSNTLRTVLESYAAFMTGLLAKYRAARSKDCDWVQDKYSSVMRLGASISPTLCVQWVENQAIQCGGEVPPHVLEQLDDWLELQGQLNQPLSARKHCSAIRTSARVWGCCARTHRAQYEAHRTESLREETMKVFTFGLSACVRAHVAAAKFDIQEENFTSADQLADLRCFIDDFLNFWASSHCTSAGTHLSTDAFCKSLVSFQDRVLTDVAIGTVPVTVIDIVRAAFLRLARTLAQNDSGTAKLDVSHVRSIIASIARLPLPPSVDFHLAILEFESTATKGSGRSEEHLLRAMDRALRECASLGSASEPLWLECIRICAMRADWQAASKYVWRARQELPTQSDSFLQQVVGMGVVL